MEHSDEKKKRAYQDLERYPQLAENLSKKWFKWLVSNLIDWHKTWASYAKILMLKRKNIK